MRELNLRSVLWPTSGNLKCIPNSSVSDNKGIINGKKNNRLQNKKPDCCSSQFHLPPCEPETLSAPFYHAVSQTPKPNPGSLKNRPVLFSLDDENGPTETTKNDSFMIHCGPKILILYHVISCNPNYLEVKSQHSGYC